MNARWTLTGSAPGGNPGDAIDGHLKGVPLTLRARIATC